MTVPFFPVLLLANKNNNNNKHHNTTNKARKTLKDGKKWVDCLGTLEEQSSDKFPGFPYCLQHIPNRVLQKPPSQNHQ